jgi:hypothetical protein
MTDAKKMRELADERRAFERWLPDELMPSEFSHSYLFKSDGDGDYEHDFVRNYWKGWLGHALRTASNQLTAGTTEELTHTRSCGYFDDEVGCTCCLEERKALATEQTMHRAWRKRAEEAESALAALTAGTGVREALEAAQSYLRSTAPNSASHVLAKITRALTAPAVSGDAMTVKEALEHARSIIRDLATSTRDPEYKDALKKTENALAALPSTQPSSDKSAQSAPAASTGDTQSGARPPASAAMGQSVGADTTAPPPLDPATIEALGRLHAYILHHYGAAAEGGKAADNFERDLAAQIRALGGRT